MKAAVIRSLLRKGPRELLDRGLTFIESRFDQGHEGTKYMHRPSAELLDRAGQLSSYLREQPLEDIVRHVTEQQEHASLPASGVRHDAGFALAAFCYAYCRAARPEVVMETGVGNGVTTSFILQALKVNSKGRLLSIDLPPLGYASGSFIPEALKQRWELHVGRSRRLLPGLLNKMGSVDAFLHDSLHTYRNMMFEYRTAWPALRSGGLLLSDDVAFNHAFEHFASRPDVAYAAVDEAAFFGVALKG
jgi:predicted O-methyltransferase YrrM